MGGVPCPNLGRPRDRTVDRGWCPKPDNRCARSPGSAAVLYVGGEGMHRIAGVRRQSLAAVDSTAGTHRVEPGRPPPDVRHLRPRARQGCDLRHRGVPASAARRGEHGGDQPRERPRDALRPEPGRRTHTATPRSRPRSRRARSTSGELRPVGGLPRDSFARLDPVTGQRAPSVVSPICPTALAATARALLAGTSLGCEAFEGPLRALSLPELKPTAWQSQLPRLDVEALGAGPGSIVAVSAKSRFDPARGRSPPRRERPPALHLTRPADRSPTRWPWATAWCWWAPARRSTPSPGGRTRRGRTR